MNVVEILSGSSLFDMLSNDELSAVAQLTTLRRFERDALVFQEGELGDSLFVVASGEVEVLRRDPSGQLTAIATLGPGQCFGEMSLIDKEYRSATVRARSECELLHLGAEQLTAFRKQHRDGFTFVIINIARMLSARLREANTRLAAVNPGPRP
ncbi:MAG: cyclic nucleotide-binding domain-containing protein [Myxococcaceae bacterium]|nr:cyclic nucleotide-binding domain-containing protein [Myxococcaceae bacterium]